MIATALGGGSEADWKLSTMVPRAQREQEEAPLWITERSRVVDMGGWDQAVLSRLVTHLPRSKNQPRWMVRNENMNGRYDL